MIKLLSKFFKKTPERTQNFMFIDGDNGQSKAVTTTIVKETPNWSFFWVQNKNAAQSKYLKNISCLDVIHPSNYGKESSDTFIAMDVVRKSSRDDTKSIVILSCDLDFLDICVNAGKMFPDVIYTLMLNRHGAGIKKMKVENLPDNVKIIYFHSKSVI